MDSGEEKLTLRELNEAAHDALVKSHPVDQRKYLSPRRAHVDEFLDAEYRSENCHGADHTRVLLNALKVLRRATHDNGPKE